MASRRSRISFLLAATLCSAALFYLGTGLRPVGWLTWLAPLPVLLLAPRVSGRVIAVAAFVAYLLGLANVALYYTRDLTLPLPLVAGVFACTSGVFCLVVLAFRGLLVRGRPLLAVVTTASAWAGAEYLFATLLPFGANWTLATTQADLLPVLQVASATGAWGVSFLVMGVPAAVAAVVAPALPGRRRMRTGLAASVTVLLALGYGAVRLHEPAGTPTVRVAAVAAALPGGDQPEAGTSAGRKLLDSDVAAMRVLPDRTRIVVFPEKDFVADDTSLPGLTRRFAEAARATGTVAVVGVELRTQGKLSNVALVVPPDGSAPVVYHKRYLAPGVEYEFEAGHERSFVPGLTHRVAVAICADMGRPSLGRDNARAGARMMAVPALDFDVDAWSQSRVQYLRGVENGFSVVRASRQGVLTLTDDNGRVIREVRADGPRPVTTVTADLPVPEGTTLYTRWGDWFGLVCLILTALGIAALARPRATGSAVSRRPTAEGRSRTPAGA
ncbi:MAG: nitrilase [Streptosporangiales bacterium]|nr:nitrilase [Streptosporangiales bacterium]